MAILDTIDNIINGVSDKVEGGGNSGDASKRLGAGFWGEVVDTVGGLATSFNYKGQENQIEIARLNAQAAASQAEAAKGASNKKFLLIGGGVLAFIIVIMLLRKK